MARIRCKYSGCTFLDTGLCTATSIELDPDEGCLTFNQLGDPFDDDEWDDDDLEGYEEWDDDEDDDLSDSLLDEDDF